MRGFSRHASRASCRSARARGWLCIPPAGEASTIPATRSGAVCDLQAYRSAHGIADQDHPLQTQRVENLQQHPGQRRDPQGMTPSSALSVAGQIGDHRRRAVRQRPGGRQQIAARDPEAVHMHQRNRASHLRTHAHEDQTPVHLDPKRVPARIGHNAIVCTRRPCASHPRLNSRSWVELHDPDVRPGWRGVARGGGDTLGSLLDETVAPAPVVDAALAHQVHRARCRSRP